MKRYIIILALGIFTIYSCTKEDSIQGVKKIEKTDQITVPSGFSWENSRDVYFDVKIVDTRFGDAFHVISVYDSDPQYGGRLLSKGSASVNSNFATRFYLPNVIKEVYVVKTAPDNSATTEKVEITGPKINLSMLSGAGGKVMDTGGNKISGLEDSPNCTSGCDATVSSSNSNLTVERDDIVCVTGSNITISVTIRRGGTLRICGTNVTVQNANLERDASIIVTTSGSVTFSSLNLNDNSESLINYGTVTMSGSFSPGGIVTNEGVMSTGGDFNLNTDATFKNYGTINVNGSMEVGASTESVNSGSITLNNNFQINSSRSFVNNCFLWVKGNYNNSGRMKNYNLIKVNNTTTVNGSTEVSLYAGAMLQTTTMMLNGTLKGYSSTSLVKVSGSSTINSNGRVSDALQYCDANGIETNNGAFTGAAVQACSVYIPVTNCNSSGNGTPPVVDTDGDGVNDTLDEYPNDATKAYNNYYPSVSPTSGATIAFEDKWPQKGDYDMNDVVVSYRYKIVTNAANKVVQVNGDYTLQATGGDFKNGFGVEFPILRTAASGTTGGTLETGQTNAVVILFTDMRAQMLQWNTKPGVAITTPKNFSISFNVSNGPSISSFGLGPYNPFIWDNGNTNNGRGREIHLPGKPPTSKANLALFGTGDDNSSTSAARYYVTPTGLPWAMNIPIKPFVYPYEQTGIILGYLRFQAWAESGGTQYPDWYSNTGSGYRDQSKLYQEP